MSGTSNASDPVSRLARAHASLHGLAMGDAIGEMLASRHYRARDIIAAGLPAGPWIHTDDTEMALSIFGVLRDFGRIDQDALARRFAERYRRDPDRGYGKMTRIQLRRMLGGEDWRVTSASAFSGQGSMGNGGAMRVAPLGAYFADDISRAIEEAHKSCVVTHTHPEAVAGTVAVAVAVAMAWQLREAEGPHRIPALFETVIRHTPESLVSKGLKMAAELPGEFSALNAGRILGNGSLVTAQDTVPFAVWSAAHHLNDPVAAIAFTISADGDCDTNAAIVSAIVALSAGIEAYPAEWRTSAEPLMV